LDTIKARKMEQIKTRTTFLTSVLWVKTEHQKKNAMYCSREIW